MKLQLVKFKDIKPEGKYIFRSEVFSISLEITNGKQTILDILEYYHVIEEGVPIEDVNLKKALEYCNKRQSQGEGWDGLEIYEVIS